MNESNTLNYVYENFQFVDDILINHPQGLYSKTMVTASFSTIIEAVTEKNIPSWYFLEKLGPNLQGPKIPIYLLLNFYKSLKLLGCQRVIVVSKLPILSRTFILNIMRRSGLPVDTMPDEEKAILWIQYLKACQEEPLITSSRYSTY